MDITQVLKNLLTKPENWAEVMQLLQAFWYTPDKWDPWDFLLESITYAFFMQYIDQSQVQAITEYFWYNPERDGKLIPFLLQQVQWVTQDKIASNEWESDAWLE